MTSANLLAAMLAFHQHRYAPGCVNLACALFLIGLNVRIAWSRKKERAAVLAAQQREMEVFLKYMERAMGARAAELSRANLELVVKALGAKLHRDIDEHYILTCGKVTFIVRYGAVYRGNFNSADSTCTTGAGLPPLEQIATVLLLLKNNPKVFEKWRDNPGTPYF